MAQSNVSSVDTSEIGTILSEGVVFEGVATFLRPVLVNCSLQGTIKSESDVFISAGAELRSDISARRISIKGKVSGTIKASDRIELFRTARIKGTLETVDLIMQSGAILNAQCIMPEGEPT